MNTVNRSSNQIQVKGKSLPVTVKQAIINISAAGDNIVVEAVADKKIRVIARWYRSSGTNTMTPKSGVGAGATAIGGADYLKEGYGVSDCWAPHGYFYETGTGEALNFHLAQAVQLSGELDYIEF